MLIEIFSDLVCPWCYIGKRRLDMALAQRPGLPVDIRWLPFQLNPDMPSGGVERSIWLTSKFGSGDRLRQFFAVIEQTARRDGLDIALDRIRRVPNTLDAHRLVLLAEGEGLAGAVTDSLFRAYFVEGRDIGDRTVLTDIAALHGFDGDEAAAWLDNPASATAVLALDAQARRIGIQGVPCFVFDRKYAVTGAQDTAAFRPFLDLAQGDAAISA